jgi:hypothetical protein
MRASKGSSFERKICKQLSLWWSEGKRDDIFWRSSQSGGRATSRAQKGLSTYGSYGDIAAVDPIGEPLLKLFTIELKRGDSHKTPADLIDVEGDNSKHPWMKCLQQTIRQHKAAGSVGWMMIFKRDFRAAMVCIESSIYKYFVGRGKVTMRMRFILTSKRQRLDFCVLPLDQFLSTTSPKDILRVLSRLGGGRPWPAV